MEIVRKPRATKGVTQLMVVGDDGLPAPAGKRTKTLAFAAVAGLVAFTARKPMVRLPAAAAAVALVILAKREG